MSVKPSCKLLPLVKNTQIEGSPVLKTSGEWSVAQVRLCLAYHILVVVVRHSYVHKRVAENVTDLLHFSVRGYFW